MIDRAQLIELERELSTPGALDAPGAILRFNDRIETLLEPALRERRRYNYSAMIDAGAPSCYLQTADRAIALIAAILPGAALTIFTHPSTRRQTVLVRPARATASSSASSPLEGTPLAVAVTLATLRALIEHPETERIASL